MTLIAADSSFSGCHHPQVASLDIVRTAETLAEMGMVDLEGDGPWPGEPENEDAYEVDWAEAQPTSAAAVETADDRPQRRWETAVEVVRERARSGFHTPPDDVLDALAWYTPIHYFGPAAAIYVRERAIVDLAAAILNHLPREQRWLEANVAGASRAALSALYLHEAFHHKIESFATRLEVVQRERRYLRYSETIVQPLLREGSDDVLEEALACAEMFRRASEPVYKRGVPLSVQHAAGEMLRRWFPELPPSYRLANRFLSKPQFDGALAVLMGQLQEAKLQPRRDPVEWALAPQLHRGLFDCQAITHVLVPLHEEPIFPWIGRKSAALPAVSTREAARLLTDAGWQLLPMRGKGSHLVLRRAGHASVTLPANREALSPGVIKSVASALAVRPHDLMSLRRPSVPG